MIDPNIENLSKRIDLLFTKIHEIKREVSILAQQPSAIDKCVEEIEAKSQEISMSPEGGPVITIFTEDIEAAIKKHFPKG